MKKIPQNSKNIHSSFQKFLLKCKGTAKIRTMQEEKSQNVDGLKCFKAWNLEVNNNLTTQRFKKALNESMKMHLDIKIRYMQFRILHRYIGTNHQVAKFRDDISDKCTFCEKRLGDTKNNETIQHLFFRCETTNKILTQYYRKHLNREIEYLNEENFIFTPLVKDDDTDKFLKNVNMLIKFYLWSCKMRKMTPTLETCKKYVKYHALCIAKGLEISGNYNYMKKITENTITDSEIAMEISELK